MLQRRRGMRRVRGGWLAIAMAVGACGFPKLPQLDDSDPQSDGGVPGGDGGMPGDGGLDGPDTGELSLVLLAGSIGGEGNLNGRGAAARLTYPQNLCVDPSGNLFVLEQNTIRKITSSGDVSTFAGMWQVTGSSDGTGGVARFSNPSGIVADSTGTMFIADTGNHTIRRVTPQGVVTTVAGAPGLFGSADGAGATARFRAPTGIGISGGELWVADSQNHIIRRISASGVVTTVAGLPGVAGYADGDIGISRFNRPLSVTADASGAYIVDSENYIIRHISQSGYTSTIAGTAGLRGSADGAGNAATFYAPTEIASDRNGAFYIVERDAHRIRRMLPDGAVTTLAPPNGYAPYYPRGIAANNTGDVLISSSFHEIIRWHSNGTGSVVAGMKTDTGYAEGVGASARFINDPGIVVAGDGILIADRDNHVLRRVTLNGATSLWAGTPTVRGNQEGSRLEARFELPSSLAADSGGNIYVADSCAIRKISPDGAVMTLAGISTVCGTIDAIGADARFESISGIAVSADGIVYVAQSTRRVIRKVTQQGLVSTLAGAVGQIGRADGLGGAARFGLPTGLAVDGAGNIYVADDTNSTIRKVTSAGEVSTLAGGVVNGHVDATGALARFNRPRAVTVDASGNVYVADTGNHAIRKVTPAGVVTTIAGSPASIGIRLGTSPSFASPSRIALLGDSLLIVDGASVIALRHGAR